MRNEEPMRQRAKMAGEVVVMTLALWVLLLGIRPAVDAMANALLFAMR
jgi:hypothetical protein